MERYTLSESSVDIIARGGNKYENHAIQENCRTCQLFTAVVPMTPEFCTLIDNYKEYKSQCLSGTLESFTITTGHKAIQMQRSLKIVRKRIESTRIIQRRPWLGFEFFQMKKVQEDLNENLREYEKEQEIRRELFERFYKEAEEQRSVFDRELRALIAGIIV